MKFFLVIACSLLLVSCKISYTLNGGTVPEGAKTISVEFFPNNAPLASPTLSQDFTESLRDVFQSQTRLDLISTGGDLQFEGSITGYAVRPVAIQSNETSATNRLTITVFVKYNNTTSDENEGGFETSFSRFADFSSALELSAVESALIDEINAQLVQDIYDRALSNW
jgi:hypothetical protein